MLNNKTILVTGGTGSFGKHFISTVFKKYSPKKMIVFSRDELKQFEMENSSRFKKPEMSEKLRFFIGDVRDLQRLTRAMNGVDIVIHAAALKQVPACEYNPFEAVKTNIYGAQNVIDAAISNGIEKVVALSTDKACAPINLYGATKLASDKLFVAANNFSGGHKIKFSVVRYGNVMGSRGSVIPFFQTRKKDGVLPVTDERMTRFNITLDDGIDFVLTSLEKMWGGEIFVPKIPSYKILDIAEAICPKCTIENVGIRPGEKIHEEMITSTDAMNTIEFANYFVILPSVKLWDVDDFANNHNDKPGTFCENGFCYNSGTNKEFLTVEELQHLINNEMSI
jgi:UDP-N-acetylglucosamine 4,6-dehydratase (inverting)